METSILKSTKKVLGLGESNTAFDLDILTLINSTFLILRQLGVGPVEGYSIEDETANWSDYPEPEHIGLIRTYMFLKVRATFDPPTTSFHISNLNSQIEEMEHRIRTEKEVEE